MKKIFRWLKIQLAWLISREVLAAINDPNKTYDEVQQIAESVADSWGKKK